MPVKTKKWLGILLCPVLLLVLLAGILLAIRLPAAPPDTLPETQTTVAETLGALPPNPFGAEDFRYVDGFLTGPDGTCIPGIDVSSHQESVDWQQVKAAGMEFVMIRLAYRGSIEGALIPDEMAQDHYRGAKEAGLLVGGYIFTQSVSPDEGVEDAQYVLELSRDWVLDLPLVYDWELIDERYRNGNVDRQTLTDTMLSFCQTVEASGKEAMIYFNITNTRNNFYLGKVSDYDFWLASYSDKLDFPYRVDMWQYTNCGRVPGIEGDVDINLYFPK